MSAAALVAPVEVQYPTEDPASFLMTPGDLEHWRAVEGWKRRTLPEREWVLLVADGWGLLGSAVSAGLRMLPGVSAVDGALGDLLGGLGAIGSWLGRTSVGPAGVLAAFRRHGHDVTALADVRVLEVTEIHAVRPALTRSYVAASALHGGVSGVLAGLAAASAGGGGHHGSGVPGVAAVAAVLGADIVLTTATCTRAVAHVAAYYGYDTRGEDERAVALAVLAVTLTDAHAKSDSYADLRSLQAPPSSATPRTTLPRLALAVQQRLAARLGHREVAQALPALGVGLGALLSARLLSRVLDDADHLYRERFLREKYGLPEHA